MIDSWNRRTEGRSDGIPNTRDVRCTHKERSFQHTMTQKSAALEDPRFGQVLAEFGADPTKAMRKHKVGEWVAFSVYHTNAPGEGS